jgi:hypothetical protein
MQFRGKTYTAFTYRIHYIYHAAIGCGGSCLPNSATLGFHNVDREHVVILRDEETNTYAWVFFSAHNMEGKWRTAKSCAWSNMSSGAHLHVYVALGSHANYPTPTTWWRIFGLANDRCSKRGDILVPRIVFDPCTKDFHPKEHRKDSFWFRFLLPVYMHRAKKQQQKRDDAQLLESQ